MADTLKLRTNNTPTMFNPEMMLGGLIGAMFGGFPVMALTVATGALIGGWLGKKRLENENRDGKDVVPPTGWNREAAIGGIAGHFIGQVAAAMAFIGVSGVSLAGGTFPAEASLAPAAGAAFASWLGSTAIGTWIGSRVGRRRMAQEYLMAAQQLAAEQQVKTTGLEQTQQGVDAPGKSFAQQIEAERALAAAQQAGR